MKSLIDYIKESVEDDKKLTTDITFDFTDLENGEDTVKSLTDLGAEHAITVGVDGQKVTITFTKDTLKEADALIDVLQQATEVLGKSQKRTSDEQYAQKIQKLEKQMQKLHEFMDKCAEPKDDDTDPKGGDAEPKDDDTDPKGGDNK